MRSPYREVVESEAAARSLDPLLVEAVIWQESSGQADAFRFEPGYWERYCKGKPEWEGWEPRRVASSYGLMQVMYPTALAYGYEGPPEGLFVIPVNIGVGCAVLAGLLKQFSGNVEDALAAYNGGPGGIGRPGPRSYAIRVTDRYERLAAASARVDRTPRRA